MCDNITFEDAIAELEGTVKKLENGAMTLDASLSAFEKAVKLIKICNDRLEDAEQRVRVLIEGKDGAITDMPFASKNEN